MKQILKNKNKNKNYNLDLIFVIKIQALIYRELEPTELLLQYYIRICWNIGVEYNIGKYWSCKAIIEDKIRAWSHDAK